MPRPRAAFKYNRPDEVAECWEGVPSDLCRKLWDCMANAKPIPNLEDSGPGDHVGHENLAKKKHWSTLTDDEQRLLNRLSDERDAKWG